MAAELPSQKTPSAWLGEISHCSARANAKKTHVILDLRPVLFGSIAKHADTIIKLLGRKAGQKATGWSHPSSAGTHLGRKWHCLIAPALLSIDVGWGLFYSFSQGSGTATSVPALLHCRVALTHV